MVDKLKWNKTVNKPLMIEPLMHTERKTEEEVWRQIEGGHMLYLYHIPHYREDKIHL